MMLLREEAKRLGETTVFTATQSAKAMEELGRAGQSTTQIMKTTNAALDLAAANAENLADAAKLTAVQMNVFNHTGIRAREVVDLINQTVTSSPMNFTSLSYALQFSSGTAAAAGIDFKELTQILGAMAENGIEGSKAGRALNVALAKMLKQSNAGHKALAKYGLTLEDINPQTHRFADIIDTLNEKQVELADLMTLFGIEAAPKFLKMITIGGDAIRNFAVKQADANTALESARVRLDNLQGDVTLFTSALTSLGINIFEFINEPLRAVVQSATDVVRGINEIVKAIQTNLSTVPAKIHPLITAFKDLYTAQKKIREEKSAEELANDLGKIYGVAGVDVTKILQDLNKIDKEFGKASESSTAILRQLDPAIDELDGSFGMLSRSVDDLGTNWNALSDAISKTPRNMWRNVSQEILNTAYAQIQFQGEMKETSAEVRKQEKDLQTLIETLRVYSDPDVFYDIPPVVQEISNTTISELREISSEAAKAFDFNSYVTQPELHLDKLKRDINEAKGMIERAFSVGNIPEKPTRIKDKDPFSLGISLDEVQERFPDTNKWLELLKTPLFGGDFFNNLFSSISGVDLKGFKEMFGEGLNFENLKHVFSKETFSNLGDLLLNSFKKGFTLENIGGFFKSYAQITGTLVKGLMSLYGAVWNLFMSNEDFKAAFDEIMSTVAEVIGPVAKAFIPVLKAISGGIKDMAPFFQKIANDLVPVVKDLVTFFNELMVALQPIIKIITNMLIEILKDTLEILGPALINLVEALEPVIDALSRIIVPLMQSLNENLVEIINVIIELLPLVEAVLEVIVQLMPLIRSLNFLLTRLALLPFYILFGIFAILGALYNFLKPAFDWMQKTFSPLITNIQTALNTLSTGLTNVYDAIYDFLDKIGSLIENAIKSALGAGEEGFSSVKGFMDTLTGGIISGLSGGLPFAQGNDYLTKDQLMRLPGMEPNSGLIKAHVGESIGKPSGSNTFNFNVKSTNPREAAEEIRQMLEEMSLSGRFAVGGM